MLFGRRRQTDQPLISVLLAVYNGEKYLHEAIDSVLRQTYTNFELLIGFNGTTDQSREIASRFRDARIRMYDYGADKGKAKTLNKLLQHANGNWIAIQDDDDIWMPKKLLIQVQHIAEADVIGTFIVYIDESGQTIGKPKLAQKHATIKKLSLGGVNQIANTSTILRAEVLRSVAGWDEMVDGIEDFDLWLRLLRKGHVFLNVPSILVKHRLHKKSNFNTKQHNLAAILGRAASAPP